MVLLAAAGICYSFYHQTRAELVAARAEHSRVEAQAAALQVENERIAVEIRDLRSNPEVIEQAARQRLGMIRPGDVVLAVNRGVTQ